jgi:Rab GDP dissociation inhibitor
MKVLHIDRNSFYGGEGASVNLTNLWKIFKPNVEVPKQYGANRDWNIDLVPKFIMSNGKLVKILLKTRVAKYLEWKCKKKELLKSLDEMLIFLPFFFETNPNSNR